MLTIQTLITLGYGYYVAVKDEKKSDVMKIEQKKGEIIVCKKRA